MPVPCRGAVLLGPTKFTWPVFEGQFGEEWRVGGHFVLGALGTEDLDWLIFGKSINQGHKACMQCDIFFCFTVYSTLGTLSAMPAKAGWCHSIFII